MAAKITVTAKEVGLQRLIAKLRAAQNPAETMTNLHMRWGIQGLNWVNDNFQKQGALTGTRWAPLAKSTIAGRRKGSSLILIDTGELRKSFHETHDTTSATIGSPLFYSEFHNDGRRGPWTIVPKKKRGLLAFKGADGKMVFSKRVQHPGYPQRRMLPTKNDKTFIDKLKKVATNLIAEMFGKK